MLLTTVALLALTGAGQAAIIGDLGPNPNTNVGRNPGAGAFDDFYTFTITQDMTITLASITNGYPGGIGSGQFIANFTGAVLDLGIDHVLGGGNDTFVIGPTQATSPCQNQVLCQALAGSAFLDTGFYALELSGIAGASASYGGTLSTAAVPGPIVGAGLPGLITACAGMWGFARRRRNKVA